MALKYGAAIPSVGRQIIHKLPADTNIARILNLQTGQAYKLVLKNVDKVKHELDPAEFGAKVFTRKVEVMGHDGNMIAEIKGSVREIEVGPGGEVEWFIVPVQTGTNLAIECALKGHKEAGMVGTVTIN